MESDFLKYIDDWEATVQGNDEYTATQKQQMCLSRETVEGLRITGSDEYYDSTCGGICLLNTFILSVL